jgi:adhesin/invasin
MRSTLRVAGLFVFAVAAITCTDAPTAPASGSSRTSARIALAPSFGTEAARAYRALTQFGFEITNVRIRLTAADGALSKDTVISFPSAQDTLHVDLSVQVQGSEQTFVALIELRDANNVVLFSGTKLVIARPRGIPDAPPPAVALEYAGPGRDARSVMILPTDTTITATDTDALTATALDATGRPVPDLLVRWTSSDATLATITATGGSTATLRGAGKRGRATITAITPTGVTATARVSLVPSAARLAVIGGAGQTGVAGRTLERPFVVELQAADGGPAANAVVMFRATSAGGAVTTTAARSDSVGRASTAISLGRTAGTYTFEASSGSLAPASISAIATPAPGAALSIVSGDQQSDLIGSPLGQPLTVRVTDEFGSVVVGTAISWIPLRRSGSVATATSLSDGNGLASASYSLGTIAGVDSVRARLAVSADSEVSVLFTARAIARGPSRIWFHAGASQTGTAGAKLAVAPEVFVGDAFDNPVPGISVNWSSTGLLATFSPITSVTDPDGFARTNVTLPATAGTFAVVAKAGALSAMTTMRALAGAASTFVPLQSLPNEVSVGVPPTTSLRVQLSDALGNAVAQAGVAVSATAVITPGGGAPLASTETSDAQGIVSFSLPAYVGPRGSATITLTASGFTPLALPPISFVTGPAAMLSIVTQPSATAPSGSTFAVQPMVTITDAGANSLAVAGTMVTVFIASGGGVLGGTTSVTTDATGAAVFTDLSITGSPGLRTLGFSSGTLPDVMSDPMDVGAAVPTTIGAPAALAP